MGTEEDLVHGDEEEFEGCINLVMGAFTIAVERKNACPTCLAASVIGNLSLIADLGREEINEIIDTLDNERRNKMN